MLAVSRKPLGAPGVYRLPDTPLRALTGVRMDVCGFAGIAPRGPARVPVIDESWPDYLPCVESSRPRQRSVAVPVESFDEYRRRFGAFEGPGILPYAVAAFFENGGRRAYVVRIVHKYSGDADNGGVASAAMSGFVPAAEVRARDEGSWGNQLRMSIVLNPRTLGLLKVEKNGFDIRSGLDLTEGALLRLSLTDGTRLLRFVKRLADEPDPGSPRAIRRAGFDDPLPVDSDNAHIEVVEAEVGIDDGDGRRERFDHVGLHSSHPRWLATVLCYESELVYPTESWAYAQLLPSGIDLPGSPAISFSGGEDRYSDIEPEDFFDDEWTPDDEQPGEGVQAFARISDLVSLAVPDLYSPSPLPDSVPIVDPRSLAGPVFSLCLDINSAPAEQERPAEDLPNLRLDPLDDGDFDRIVQYQNMLVEFAEKTRDFVVLLDVPPGLRRLKLLEWRAAFDSSYAAAYHPWLRVARRDDSRDRLILLPPSSVAAGIIARTEFDFGIAHGPANSLGKEVVSVREAVSPEEHDELHPLGINVYLQERDGVRLTAARTLSSDKSLRQLSVRRLMIMLRRTLEQQMQWVVFEPNGPALWAQLGQLLRQYLHRLFLAGAFRGASDEEAFFVRCDAGLHPQAVLDAGMLIAEIGVSPAEPLEFILLRLSRDGDGTLMVTE